MRSAPASGAEPVERTVPRRRSLIAPAWRVPAIALLVTCVAAFTVLAVLLHGTRHATGFDGRVLRWLFFHIGPDGAQIGLDATNEILVLTAIAFAVLGCLVVRRWDAAALVAVTPAVSVALTEFVLKPMVGRRSADGVASGFDEISNYAFPSGHTAALSGLTVSAALVVLRAPVARWARAGAVLLLAAWTVVGAAGLVRNFYHYATDTVGGALVSISCALAVALVIDGVRRVS